MADQQRSEGGFSLLEVLTALFIIALISTSGTAILMRTVDSRGALENLSERMASVHQTHALMRDDLAQWMPRNFRARETVDLPSRFLGGDVSEPEHLMSFVRNGRLNPGYQENHSGLFVVRYRVEDGRLIRILRLSVDGVVGTPEFEQVLIEGVTDFQIRFWDGNAWIRQFASKAGAEKGAPEAVRLSLTLEDGRAFEWKFLTPVRGQDA